MPPGFANSAAKNIAVFLSLLAAAWLSCAGGQHEIANHYAASANPGNWERAARIEPGNPEIWYQLARYRHLDFDNADIPLAISYYRRAEQLNPRSPYYKLDLASALEIVGNASEADAEFRAAQSAYPISPEVAWKYGNFLLRQDRVPEAVGEIHRALLVDPALLALAISRVWRSTPDVHLLLDQVLPENPAAYQQALSFLSDAGDTAAALEAWHRLVAKNPHPDLRWVFKLTDLLVEKQQFDIAEGVWREATGTQSASEQGSLIYDGGFEKDISGGGFGWQQTVIEGANFDFDTGEKRSGERSARLTFDGSSNTVYQNLFQYVLVSPSTHYHFQGYLRTDQISTDSGIRFEVSDPKDGRSLDLLTANVTGTEPWTLEQGDFATGPGTHVILVRVARRPSERLDNKIRGTAWVDDVAIVRANPKSEGNGPNAPAQSRKSSQAR